MVRAGVSRCSGIQQRLPVRGDDHFAVAGRRGIDDAQQLTFRIAVVGQYRNQQRYLLDGIGGVGYSDRRVVDRHYLHAHRAAGLSVVSIAYCIAEHITTDEVLCWGIGHALSVCGDLGFAIGRELSGYHRDGCPPSAAVVGQDRHFYCTVLNGHHRLPEHLHG